MIKFLVMDVDGTLTDGKIYMGDNGECFKCFDIKDGYGIKEVLPSLEILPVVITARKSKIVENRCYELGIENLFQGERNKLECLERVIRNFNQKHGSTYSLEQCAYIGDDLLDINVMQRVMEAGGIAACPADAVMEIRNIVTYTCKCNGGAGAVREVIDMICSNQSN